MKSPSCLISDSCVAPNGVRPIMWSSPSLSHRRVSHAQSTTLSLKSIASASKTNDFINELPVEILAHIFDLTVMRIPYRLTVKIDLHSYLTPRSKKRTLSPFNLLQVCQYWREIARSTSSLWSHLNGSQYYPARPSLPGMRHWLSLSRTAPLHLRLVSRSHEPKYDALHSTQMLRIFAAESHRWKSFAVQLDPPIIPHFIDLLAASDAVAKFSHLEQLEISFCPQTKSEISEDLVEDLIHGIASLKSLRHLYWNYRRTIHPPEGFSWSRLETVYLDTPLSLQEASRYMRQCSSASTIIMVDISQECQFQPSRDIGVTVLPNLTFLQLEGRTNPTPLLSNMILSNLKTIKIGSSKPLPCGYIALENFIKTSQPPLQRVSVRHGTDFIKDDMIGYLQLPHLRTVAEVGISYYRAHEEMLSFLQKSASTKVTLDLPRLFAWYSNWSQPYVGWKDTFEVQYDTLKYKWVAGTVYHLGLDN